MKRRHRKDVHDDENLERWLLTYADLITLLLAFFVVMYSMSQVDAKRFGRIKEALNGVLRGGQSVLNKEHTDDKTGHGLLNLGNLRLIQRHVEERFQGLKPQEDIATEITERGLVIHVMESVLFREGSATLENRAIRVLDLIAETIKPLPNHIRIEGHTDDRPIKTSVYPSNWELSSARATQVVRYYTENGFVKPDRISALGYGSYRPVRLNNSIENRARNRRVDIVVLTMELSLKEPTSQLYNLAQQ
jgi:chemotaxis protein MotB